MKKRGPEAPKMFTGFAWSNISVSCMVLCPLTRFIYGSFEMAIHTLAPGPGQHEANPRPQHQEGFSLLMNRISLRYNPPQLGKLFATGVRGQW